jgi:hypothetical protein
MTPSILVLQKTALAASISAYVGPTVEFIDKTAALEVFGKT